MATKWCKKTWSSIEEVPYCVFGSSIKFRGHTGWKIDDLNPIWVRLLGRSQLSNPSDWPCFYRGSTGLLLEKKEKTMIDAITDGPFALLKFAIHVTCRRLHCDLRQLGPTANGLFSGKTNIWPNTDHFCGISKMVFTIVLFIALKQRVYMRDTECCRNHVVADGLAEIRCQVIGNYRILILLWLLTQVS